MSREQWGHGYWQGVVDEKYGKVRGHCDIERSAKMALYNMARWNLDATHDRGLYSVSSFCTFLRFAGVENVDEYAKSIYDFIQKYQPLDCYVSGFANDPWYKDYFVIASLLRYSRQELTDKIGELYEQEETA